MRAGRLLPSILGVWFKGIPFMESGMRLLSCLVPGLFLLQSLPSVALADGAGKAVIEGQGIDGRWAVTCSRPASVDNPYLVFETFREGPPEQRRIAPPDEERVVPLLDVQWKKASRELVWTIAEGEVMLTVTSRLEGNRMRVQSIIATDGTKLVAEARDSDGRPTPWLNKCETN